MVDVSEKSLEETIESALIGKMVELPDGASLSKETGNIFAQEKLESYHKRTQEDYDKALCLVPKDVLSFIYATHAKDGKSSNNITARR